MLRKVYNQHNTNKASEVRRKWATFGKMGAAAVYHRVSLTTLTVRLVLNTDNVDSQNTNNFDSQTSVEYWQRWQSGLVLNTNNVDSQD